MDQSGLSRNNAGALYDVTDCLVPTSFHEEVKHLGIVPDQLVGLYVEHKIPRIDQREFDLRLKIEKDMNQLIWILRFNPKITYQVDLVCS